MTVDDQGADDSCRRNEQNGRNGMIAGLGPRLWVRLQCNGMIAGLRPSGCNALQQRCCRIEQNEREKKTRERDRCKINSYDICMGMLDMLVMFKKMFEKMREKKQRERERDRSNS